MFIIYQHELQRKKHEISIRNYTFDEKNHLIESSSMLTVLIQKKNSVLGLRVSRGWENWRENDKSRDRLENFR